jgi:hypothetical protein
MLIWRQNYEALQPERIRDALGTLNTVNTESLSTDDLANLARLQKALHVLDARMSSLDPELFHPSGWGSIASWLTNVLTYVREFAQSANPSQLQNANNTVDEILNVLRPIDVGPPADLARALLEASTSFQQRLLDELERMRRKLLQLDAQFATLTAGTQSAAVDVDALRQTIDQQKARLDQSIAEFQKQFSQAEATRVSEFSAAMQRFLVDFGAQKTAFLTEANAASEARTVEWTSFKEKSEKAAADFMTFFTKRQDEVNAIFGAIGSASLSGHFARTADTDATAANRLRWIALALMAAMVVVGGISFYQSFEHPDVDWKIFLFRLATVFVIAIPAVYAAQESSKHRRREQQNRKMQVELASIDAYLVDLPEPKRHELKEKLTEKFFGQPDTPESDDPVTRHQLLDLIGDTMKSLTKSR